MFYYYGRKKQLGKYYPSPNYETIIEPFAGSAAYSLRDENWKNRVILLEKDKKVADIWEWLIEEATAELIQALPDLKVGEKSSEFLHIIHAASKMAFKYRTIKVTPVLARNWEISKRVMASNLFKVKHWEIMNTDYSEAPAIEATWFIDPPYKDSPGLGYAHSSAHLNYTDLANWIGGLSGDVIACEGEFGDYLPFRNLKELKGVAGKTSTEKIYYRSDFVEEQMKLFA